MKKLLYAVIGVLVLCGVALVAITTLVNPDQVKQVLVEQVKAKTGRTLLIDGDLSWSFFPSLGFTLGHTALQNPAGFPAGNTVSVDQVAMDVELMPLLSKEIKVGELTLAGAKLHLITLANGRTNLEGLNQQAAVSAQTAKGSSVTQPTQAADSAAKSEVSTPLNIEVEGVRIQKAAVIIDNRQTKQRTELSDVNFSMARFVTGREVPVTLSAKLKQAQLSATLDSQFKVWISPTLNEFRVQGMKTKLLAKGPQIPAGEKIFNIDGDFNYQKDKGVAVANPINVKMDDIDLKGDAKLVQGTVPEISFNFAGSELDLDKLLAEMKSTAKPTTKDASTQNVAVKKKDTAPKQAPSVQAKSDEEPDLSFLKSFNLNGSIKLASLKVANLLISNINLKLEVKNGVLMLHKTHADLYQGSVDMSGRVDARKTPANFMFTPQMKGVQIKSLLQDLSGTGFLGGTANMNGDLKGTGLSQQAIRRSLDGQVNLNVKNGSLYGINIPAMIRKGAALLKGQKLPPEETEQKTDFSSMKGQLNIRNGLVSTRNLQLNSPLLRVDGVGKTNLVDESMDFLFNTKIVGTLKGQGGETISELKGLTLPVKITGHWSAPKYGLDMGSLLKEKATQDLKTKVKEKLEKSLGKEGLLKGLFN